MREIPCTGEYMVSPQLTDEHDIIPQSVLHIDNNQPCRPDSNPLEACNRDVFLLRSRRWFLNLTMEYPWPYSSMSFVQVTKRNDLTIYGPIPYSYLAARSRSYAGSGDGNRFDRRRMEDKTSSAYVSLQHLDQP